MLPLSVKSPATIKTAMFQSYNTRSIKRLFSLKHFALTCSKSCVRCTTSLETFAKVSFNALIMGIPLYMKRETRRTIKELAYFSSLGLSVALSIFIGLAIGVYIDRRYNTAPWFTLIFLGLGIAAGFRNIGLAIKKSRKL